MHVFKFTFTVCLLPLQRRAGRCRADSRVCGRADSPAPPPASCGCGWSPAARGWCKGSWCSRGNWTCWGSERRDPERRPSPPQAYLERQETDIFKDSAPGIVFMYEFRCVVNPTLPLCSYLQRIEGRPPSPPGSGPDCPESSALLRPQTGSPSD